MPIVLLFFQLVSFYSFFKPSGACSCLNGSLAVQQISVLHLHFSYTFPYINSFTFTPLIPPIPSLNLLYLCFFVYRSSFQFLGRSAVTSPTVPVITSSGRVAPISVGDTVLLVEDVKYPVQKLSPLDGTVVLQKINTRDTPFKLFISQLWVPLPSSHDAVADDAMPLAPCLCPDPEPPHLLPDTCDSTTQVHIPSTTNDLGK